MFKTPPAGFSMNHTLPNLTLPTLCSLKPILMALIIEHGLINLFLRTQDKRPVLHNLLIQRQPREEDEMPVLVRILGNLGGHGVAFLLENHIVILADSRLFFADAKGRGAREGVGEGAPANGQRLGDFAAGADADVEDPDGRVGQFLDAVGAVGLAGDDLDGHVAPVYFDRGNLAGSKIAVSGLARLEFLGKVNP